MFYISYFYQLRFFDKSILPVSTAVWDPKWFHQGKGPDYTFYDKNCVLNGFRYPIISCNHVYNEERDCSDSCQKTPDTCEFLYEYEKYLDSLDFDRIVADLQRLADIHHAKDVVLLVHEAPTKPCSERGKLIKWFNNHGYSLPEWSKDMLGGARCQVQ